MENEQDPKCRELQQDYYNLIKTIGSREAITRRFLIIFEYEPTFNNRKTDYNEVVSTLETAARTARQYFLHCDNVVVSHDDENAFLLELLYTIFNRETSESIPVEKRIQQAQIYQTTHAPETELTIPTVIAPQSIDLQHGSYTVMDGLYHAYLMVPSDGFNPAWWQAGPLCWSMQVRESMLISIFSVSRKNAFRRSLASRSESIGPHQRYLGYQYGLR